MMNNSSLVMKLSKGERAVLLTSDITESELLSLAYDYGSELKCDILKLPHHGYTLPEWSFYYKTLPDFFVLTHSTSRVPKYTMDRLEVLDTPFVSTTNGTVCCVTDGEAWQIKQVYLTTDPWTIEDQ